VFENGALNTGIPRAFAAFKSTWLVPIQKHPTAINLGAASIISAPPPNALAAVSVAEFFGVAPEQIKSGFEKSRAVFGRQETFHIGDKECTLVLIKNPVGATQAIEMIKLAPYPFSLSVLLNANYADGIDTSWIWDADFEQITDMDIPEINAGGVRHSEIARRLRVTGYPADKITETSSLEQVLKTIENQDCKHAYILATYTAMLEFRELLASRQIVRKEMN